jgi:hypothetical protein
MGKMLAPVTEDVTKLSANLVPPPSLLPFSIGLITVPLPLSSFLVPLYRLCVP